MSSTTKNTKKRRRRPYGSIFRRPDGPGWLVRIPHPDGGKTKSGRPRYLIRSVETKAEGEALLKEVRKEVLKGTYFSPTAEPEPCEMTVAGAVRDYLEARRGSGCAESTLNLYGYSLKALERNGVGRKLVRDLTPPDVEQYLGWRRTHVWQTRRKPGEEPKAVPLKGGKASSSTVARDRELLCATLNRLVRTGQLAQNPVAKVPKPRKGARKRVVLSKQEVARLLEACDRHLRPVVLALVYTGARKGEVLRLTWADLCFDTGTISLYRPKVENFSRIPMHKVLTEELKRIRKERSKARGRPVPDSEHVFLSRYGRPYRSIKGAWAAAVERAGLAERGVSPHSLRHAFACHFLEGGASVTDLQAVLGHSSLVTTQIYARMVDRRTRESVAALDFSSIST